MLKTSHQFYFWDFCSPNLSPADSKQSETHCVVLQSLPPNPRARVPQGRDRFDPGGRWEVGFLPLLYLTYCFLIICCEYSFLEDFLILPYLKHLETTGLEESSFLVLVHHPFHNKNKSPSSPQTKHCWFQPIKNKLPRYLIHPQIFDSPPLSKSCWTSSATQGSLPQLPILASQWVIISSLPSRELRISNLSPILESMAISGS